MYVLRIFAYESIEWCTECKGLFSRGRYKSEESVKQSINLTWNLQDRNQESKLIEKSV